MKIAHVMRRLSFDDWGGNPFVPGMGGALRGWKPDVIHCHTMARIAELCLRTARSSRCDCNQPKDGV